MDLLFILIAEAEVLLTLCPCALSLSLIGSPDNKHCMEVRGSSQSQVMLGRRSPCILHHASHVESAILPDLPVFHYLSLKMLLLILLFW
jgi:hypothetical protein